MTPYYDEDDAEEQCQTCGGDLQSAFMWRDWQTVELVMDCTDCDGYGIAHRAARGGAA